ncbi:MAG: hypothetical protein Q8M26_08510 [Pseudolabrys sp.]|nr:hypothetical protein [Pseudolabrys sp.]
MNTNPAALTLEIVFLPIGNGWRVRISDGNHLQFISGFETQSDAEQWVRTSARAWLAKLETVAERL